MLKITTFTPELLPCWWWGKDEYDDYDNKLKELHYDDSFVHLCLHTKYSIGNSICNINDVIATAQKYDMKSIAITDFCTMKGVYEFCKEAKNAGIKPIIGCEFYVIDDNIASSGCGNNAEMISLILLAQCIGDYRAILRLITDSDVKYGCDSHYITVADLQSLYNNSLIGIAGFMLDNVSSDKIGNCLDLQKNIISKCSKEIQGAFFMGIRNLNPAFESIVMKKVHSIFDIDDIPFVSVNDIRFIRSEDYKAYAIANAAFKNKRINNLCLVPNKENYFKTSQEIKEQNEYHCAYKNAWAIAYQCDFDLKDELFMNVKHKPILIKIKPDASYWKGKITWTDNNESLFDMIIEFAKKRFKCQYAAKIIAYEDYNSLDSIMRIAATMNISSDTLSQLKAMLPNKPCVSIDAVLKQSDELKMFYRQNPEIKHLMDTTKIIQDLPWKFTTHKSAFVISAEPINIYFPMRYYEGEPMIEWPISALEDIGIPTADM